MVDVTKMLEEFPFLVPSHNFKEWNGIINVEDEEVLITISVPNFPDIKSISFMCPIHWEEKLHRRLQIYNKTLTGKDNLLQILQYLQYKEGPTTCELKVEDGGTALQLYARVLEELRVVGGDAVVDCSPDLSRVTLRVVDRRGVDHRAVVVLPSDYPSSPARIMDADLPQVAMLQLAQARTIIEIVTSMENVIESLQDFWIVFEELKNNTWIIDPENPRLKDTYCRIVVGENISMLVILNPQDVNSCPDIKFLGPENLVTPFINSVEKHLKVSGWDEDAGVCENLLSLLGLSQFPQPDTGAEVDAVQGECSICFTVRLQDDAPLPVKVCNNSRCDSYFHISCLAQWFQAVPTNEASFNLISGGCPSCGEKILCPINVS